MCIDEDKKKIHLAVEWLSAHETLNSWIGGDYLESDLHYNSVTYTTECHGVQFCTNVEGDELTWPSGELYSFPESWDPVDGLHKLRLQLESKKDLFSQLNYFTHQENDFDLFIDCFKFYSSAGIPNIYKGKREDSKVVLIVVCEDTPDWVLGTSVASALLAGYPVIINPYLKVSNLPYIPYLLAETSKEAGLPRGLINVVPGSVGTTEKLLVDSAKVVVYGDLFTRKHLGPNVLKSFSNLILGHTAFVILNNCDLAGPARKLFSAFKNWDNEKTWRPDLVVIQESILGDFLVRLFEICFPDASVEDIAYLRKEILEADHTKGLIAGINVGKLISAIDKKAMNVGFKDMGGIQLEIIIKQYESPLDPTPGSKIMKVLVCRTGKEAVELLNNFPYCLGTSIWTGNISEAMELAMELESSSVWINCHGIADPCVSLEPSRLSGTGSFGGLEGFLDMADAYDPFIPSIYKGFRRVRDEKVYSISIFQTVDGAVKAFRKWMKSDRAKYLKKVEKFIPKEWVGNTRPFDYSVDPNKYGLHAVQLKKPVGVILIVISDRDDLIHSFTNLVSPAIALGNAVIVVAIGDNQGELLEFVKDNFSHFPDGVLNILTGYDAAIALAKHPDIKAIWLNRPEYSSSEFYKFKEELLAERKSFWFANINRNWLEFHRQCLRKQTIWLPIVHRSI